MKSSRATPCLVTVVPASAEPAASTARPKAALMLFQIGFNLILLAERRDKPNDWGIIGGAIAEGESPAEAAAREAREEARLVVTRCHEGYSSDRVVVFFADAWHPVPGVGDVRTKWGTWEEAEAGSFGAFNKLLHKAVR